MTSDPQSLTVPNPGPTVALLRILEGAIRDPSVDVERLERFMKMYDAAMDRERENAFAVAMSRMQPELPIIPERGKIGIVKDGRQIGRAQGYALWEDINELIKPILAKHGFALTFRVTTDEKTVTVRGVLQHVEGWKIDTTMTLPTDLTGSKNAVQALGSSTSYGKRYTASALLNLTSRGEDDDGLGSGTKLIGEEDVEKLKSLIVEVGADIARFLKFMRIAKLEDLPADRLDAAVAELERKRAKEGTRQ